MRCGKICRVSQLQISIYNDNNNITCLAVLGIPHPAVGMFAIVLKW